MSMNVDSKDPSLRRPLYPQKLKKEIVVLGYSQVGKSAIVIQYAKSVFVDYYNPTFEDLVQKMVKFRGKDMEVNILDTLAQDEFTKLNSKYSFNIDGYVFVYSITSRKSFEIIKVINEKLLDVRGTDKIPRILLGNKSDLEYDRQVETKAGEELAKLWNCPFMEVSAKQHDCINDAFDKLYRVIQAMEEEQPASFSFTCPSIVLPVFNFSDDQLRLLSYTLRVLSMLTLVIGIIMIIAGATMSLNFVGKYGWASYGMLGLGLFSTFISVGGFYGAQNFNKDIIRVYSFGVLLVVLSQLSGMIAVLNTSIREVWKNHNPFGSTGVLIVTFIFEVASILVSCVLHQGYEPNEPSAYRLYDSRYNSV